MSLTTKDYSMFKTHENNRELNEKNIEKLIQSLSAKNLLELKPILVDKNMCIIDGQHRFEACKRLNIEVAYQINEKATHQDILLLNSNQKSWDCYDYLNYYVTQGVQDYVDIKIYLDATGLSINAFLVLFIRGGKTGKHWNKFKEGKTKFNPNSEFSQKVRSILNKVDEVISFVEKKYIGKVKRFIKSDRLKTSLTHFLSMSIVDADVFLAKLEARFDKFRPCSTREAYYSLFKEIYNFNNRNPIG